jgi:AraC-like DNA-binding protein
MDPLADILQDLRLERSFYSRSDLGAPWALSVSAKDGPIFHVLLSGRCFLRIADRRIPLRAGDLVLFPCGVDHELASEPDGPAVPWDMIPFERISENGARMSHGGDGEKATLICGGVRFSTPVAHPFLELLPPALVVHTGFGRDGQQGPPEKAPEHGWIDDTLAMLSEEAFSTRPGSGAIVRRLADVLVLQTIRAWLEDEDNRQHSSLLALADPDVGRALVLIHRKPEERWSVSSLAAEVHMSRSVFSERFSRLVGMPPMQYITQLRMHLASSWIREERQSLSEVAYRLGYSSEAAFSRAFKRHLQVPPGEIRRSA